MNTICPKPCIHKRESPCNAKSTGIPLSIHPSARSLARPITHAGNAPRTRSMFCFFITTLPPFVRSFVRSPPIRSRFESDGDTRTSTCNGPRSALWRNRFHFLPRHVTLPPSRLRVPTKSNGVSIMMMIMMPTPLPACIPRARARAPAFHPILYMHAARSLMRAQGSLSLPPVANGCVVIS